MKMKLKHTEQTDNVEKVQRPKTSFPKEQVENPDV